MPAAFPSGSNTFVKDHRATGNLVVAYSRNVESFALNRYMQLREVEKEAGYYLALTVEEAGRIMNTDLSDFVWPDGQDRPTRNEGAESFEFLDYKTIRLDFGFNLGNKAHEQAGWDIISQHTAIKAQQAMTGRTQKVITELNTIGDGAGGGPATHTSAVSAISGNTGNWGASTVARQDIKRSFNFAANTVIKDTLGAVNESDLIVVLGPDTAIEMSESQEIVDHIKGSPFALAQIKGEAPGFNTRFGLPDSLYGFKIEIEDAVKTTSHKLATAARSYVLASGISYMISRPGGLEANAGGPSFSSLTLFSFEDMTVETLTDERNRRTEGHVVDDYDAVLTAPSASFRFTDAV